MGIFHKTTMFSLVVVFILVLDCTHGSHFRGGSMSWKPIGNNQIELEYRIGFKYDHTEVRFEPCTPEAQRDHTLLKTSGVVKCDSCIGDEASRAMEWICDDYDIPEDYALGSNKLVYTVPPNTPYFVISFEQCCWVNLISPDERTGGSRGWKMMTFVNMDPRPDGKGINSSPVPSLIPLEKFYKGCQYKLRIAVTDPDDDVIRCRYANEAKGECPKDGNTRACGPHTDGLTIQKKDCTLYYDTSDVELGYHAVNVIIEDHTRPYNRKEKSLSKVSLLFLLLVEEQTEVCKKPNIVDPPKCKSVRPGEHFQMNVDAEAGDPLKPISRIKTTQRPDGMTISAMTADPESPDRQMVSLSWYPTADDIGEHPVCFSALNSDGFTSGISCTIIQVDEDPLEVNVNASIPRPDDTININDKWTIQFSKEIHRPSDPAFIRLIDVDTRVTVHEIDTSSRALVSFRGEQLHFTVPRDALFSALVNGDTAQTKRFRIKMDEGVAVNTGGCGSPPTEWEVNVEAPSIEPLCIEAPLEIIVPNHALRGYDECALKFPNEHVLIGESNAGIQYGVCCPSHC